MEADADTLPRIGPISKALCCDVFGAFAVEGAFALTDPLAGHLGPDFTVPKKNGLICTLSTSSPRRRDCRARCPVRLAGPRPVPSPGAARGPSSQIAGLPILFPPWTGALFSNWGYNLLGAALSHSAGMPYADMLTAGMLAPHDMTGAKFKLAPSSGERPTR